MENEDKYLSELQFFCKNRKGECKQDKTECPNLCLCRKIFTAVKPLYWDIEPRLTAYDTPDEIRAKLGGPNNEDF